MYKILTTAPSERPYAITPSDTVELNPVPKAIYVGTGGNIALQGVNSTTSVIFKNVANGQIIDVRALKVLATGTTATDIIGMA